MTYQNIVCALYALLLLTSHLHHLLTHILNCLHAACPAMCGLVSDSAAACLIGPGLCMIMHTECSGKSKKCLGDGFLQFLSLKRRKRQHLHLDWQCKHLSVIANICFSSEDCFDPSSAKRFCLLRSFQFNRASCQNCVE